MAKKDAERLEKAPATVMLRARMDFRANYDGVIIEVDEGELFGAPPGSEDWFVAIGYAERVVGEPATPATPEDTLPAPETRE